MSTNHDIFALQDALDDLSNRLTAIEDQSEPIPQIRFRTLNGATAPSRAHADDAGWDLRALEPFRLPVGAIAKVRTGVYVDLPEGTYGMVCSRSGIAAQGVAVVNAPGIIDSGYTGELLITVINHGQNHQWFGAGDRIAQIVFGRVDLVEVTGGDTLEPDSRGDGGHGSSGR